MAALPEPRRRRGSPASGSRARCGAAGRLVLGALVLSRAAKSASAGESGEPDDTG
ncbi:hypothetical protein LUX33_25265 [Actinomadura madurae]|uniref:hypothetical protein n=1 Tax=Actinomadura madurae TaxID=1993 RepID=UPI0020D229CF|nr:hypothetical protein [Actinomadura madurae]MCP9951407.1 hypothetical protein [Actinomadura madurae]